MLQARIADVRRMLGFKHTFVLDAYGLSAW